MRKRKYVSRRLILTAIRKEPLEAGYWVALDDNNNPVKDNNCSVCAIGATLRQSGLTNRQIESFGERLMLYGPVSTWNDEVLSSNINDILKELLEERRYLHALSLKFEDQAERTGSGKRTRKVLAQFVRKHFPKRIALNPKL